MAKTFATLVALCLVSVSMCDKSYMRRETPAGSEIQESGAFDSDGQMLASIGDSGSMQAFAEQQGSASASEEAIAASKTAYQQAFAETEAMLKAVQDKDVYDKDGFEVEQVSMKDRFEEAANSKKEQAAEMLEIEQQDRQKAADRKKLLAEGGPDAELLQSQEEEKAKKWNAESYDGKSAVVSGFWAKDRPDERRLDPNNMKVYNFTTYSKRFPFTHPWGVEAEWKKLPLAPTKVHRVAIDTTVLLEGGASTATKLVNEKMQELVYTKDSNGYYHMGTDIPTEEDMYKVAHPREYELRKQARKRALQKHVSGLYADHSHHIASIKTQLSSGRIADREDATHKLEHMFVEMQKTLKVGAKKTGKAFVSVRGVQGLVTSFNADVGKVTGQVVKTRIENVTGIPVEAQILNFKGSRVQDFDLLNKYIGGGQGAWLELASKGAEVAHDALVKRGKIPVTKRPGSPFKKATQRKDAPKKRDMLKGKIFERHFDTEAASLEEEPSTITEEEDESELEEKDFKPKSMWAPIDPKEYQEVMDDPLGEHKYFTPSELYKQKLDSMAKHGGGDDDDDTETADAPVARMIMDPAKAKQQMNMAVKADINDALKRPRHAAKAKEAPVKSESKVTQRVIYTRDEKGKWHVQKVAKPVAPLHAVFHQGTRQQPDDRILPPNSMDPYAMVQQSTKHEGTHHSADGVDEGIAVQDLVETIEAKDKETEGESLLEVANKPSHKHDEHHMHKESAKAGKDKTSLAEKEHQSEQPKELKKEKHHKKQMFGPKDTEADATEGVAEAAPSYLQK